MEERPNGEQSFYCSCFIAFASIIALKLFPDSNLGIVLGSFAVWIFSLYKDFFINAIYENYQLGNRINLSNSYIASLIFFTIAIVIAIWIFVPKADFESWEVCMRRCVMLSIIALISGLFALYLIFAQFHKTTKWTRRESAHLLFGNTLGSKILIYGEEDFFDCIRYRSDSEEFQAAYTELMHRFDQYRKRGLDPYTEHLVWLEMECYWCYLTQTPEWKALRLTYLEYQAYKRWETEAILILMFCDIGFERNQFSISIRTDRNKTKKQRPETVKSIRKKFEQELEFAIRRRTMKIPSTKVRIKS